MIYILPYEIVGGHIIVSSSNGNLLIDTGAPSSVGYDNTVSFAGRNHFVKKDFMGVSPKSLSGYIGTRINALIGADILNQYDMVISPHLRQLLVSDEEQHVDGEQLELDEFMGVPIFKASVDENTIRMFFDTGARLSYLHPNIAQTYPRIGTEQDFYPSIGRFKTETYRVPIALGGETVELVVGILPQLLRTTLMMANTSGILGTAILSDYLVGFAPRRKKLILQRLKKELPNGMEAKRYPGAPQPARLPGNVHAETGMTSVSDNPFIDLVRKASSLNWCMKPYCTTCGAMDFRSALQEVGGKLGGPLADALADVNLDELTSMPNWEDAIQIAVRDLPLPGQATALFESWLERAHQNLRFFDVVLYKLIRYLPEDHSVRVEWIVRGVYLAIQTCDFSLVESLILTLRKNALQYDQLMALAKRFAKESRQMHRVLRNACNIEIDLAQPWH
ncbi:MAG: retropepsin-like domain-containing protein [Desulfobacteraceae bacterium]|nr:retropepsin-like domain-containing protein [Actinomycetota bacterium]MCG2829817.1 retropepsin-like domain-containing protein [Desulfobacteraceae bacterium]